MIYKTNNARFSPTISLDYHGLLNVLSLLRITPDWEQRLSKTKILKKFSKSSPPEGIRLFDFLTKVSIPLEIPFYLLWVWMCTDFFIPYGMDPFEAAEEYIRDRLTDEDAQLMINDKGPLNLRKALRLRRNALGLSLAQMAKEAGVKRDRISVMERESNESSMPRCDTLNRLLPSYKLHPVELYVLALKHGGPCSNTCSDT